jgi:NitT/TauT family transport system permease protein
MKNLENTAQKSAWKRRVRALRTAPETFLAMVLLVVFVGGWELTVRVFDVPDLILPAPSAVWLALVATVMKHGFWQHVGVTLAETLGGFALGSSTGFLLGALVAQFRLLERTLYLYIVAFQAIPKVAIAPILLIWFGYGMASKIVITATIAFFPLLANTITGLRAAPADQIEMLQGFTASRADVFRMVRIPQALPYIMVGLDVAMVLSVTGAIVGEFVGSQQGLGYLILQRTSDMNMAAVFALLLVLALIGIGLHLAIKLLQRRVVFWMDDFADPISG